MRKFFAGIGGVLLLSGCSPPSLLNNPGVFPLPEEGSVSTVSLITPCMSDLSALKGLNRSAFFVYRGQFDEIERVYDIYQRDATNFGKDPKELLSMELVAKINQVCSAVKSSVYLEVQKK